MSFNCHKDIDFKNIQFKNLEKIISFYNNKISTLEKEKVISLILLSYLEDEVKKYNAESQKLKMEIEMINNFHKLEVKDVVSVGNYFKIDEIITSLIRIHKDIFDNKQLIDSEKFNEFLNNNYFDKHPTLNNDSKLNIIHVFLKYFCNLSNILFDSIHLGNLYSYYKNKLKKFIFCNLCNDFKKPSNTGSSICDRHSICENCNKN